MPSLLEALKARVREGVRVGVRDVVRVGVSEGVTVVASCLRKSVFASCLRTTSSSKKESGKEEKG